MRSSSIIVEGKPCKGVERQRICNLHRIRLSACKIYSSSSHLIELLNVWRWCFFFFSLSIKNAENYIPFHTWYLKKNVNNNVRMCAPSTSASVKMIILWYRRASFLKSSPWNEKYYVQNAWLISSSIFVTPYSVHPQREKLFHFIYHILEYRG